MAEDEHAHLVLMTALRVVDDTTLLHKNIIQDLQVCVCAGCVCVCRFVICVYVYVCVGGMCYV